MSFKHRFFWLRAALRATARALREKNRNFKKLDRLVNQAQLLNEAVRVNSKREAQEEAARVVERHHDFILSRSASRWTKATACFMAATMVVIGVQAYYTRQTLVEQQDEQRAWITVDLKPARLTWRSVNGSRAKPGQWYRPQMSPLVTISNIGHLPAYDVRLFLTGISRSMLFPLQDALPNFIRDCSNVSHSEPAHVEKVVFPNEHKEAFGFEYGVDTLNFMTSVQRQLDDNYDAYKPGATVKGFPYGCVLYQKHLDGPVLHTMFFINIDKTWGALDIFVSGEDVPADQIILKMVDEDAS